MWITISKKLDKLLCGNTMPMLTFRYSTLTTEYVRLDMSPRNMRGGGPAVSACIRYEVNSVFPVTSD